MGEKYDKCSACEEKFDRGYMNEHHIKYSRKNSPKEKTILLCENCHKLVHKVIWIIYRTPQLTHKRLETVTKAVIEGWNKDDLLSEARFASKSPLSVNSGLSKLTEKEFWKKVKDFDLPSKPSTEELSEMLPSTREENTEVRHKKLEEFC